MFRTLPFRWFSVFLVIMTSMLTQGMPTFATCPQPLCLYFPQVARTESVRINSVGYGSYPRSINFRIVGDVINTSATPVYGVQVRATLYDYTANTTTTVSGTTSFSATLPGQLNAFELGGGRNVTATEVSIVSWTTTSAQQIKNATILSTRIYSVTDNATYIYTIVSGTLRNDTGSKLNNVQVRAWSSILVELSGQPTIAQLDPGQTSTFQVTLPSYNPLALNTIKVVAQGIASP